MPLVTIGEHVRRVPFGSGLPGTNGRVRDSIFIAVSRHLVEYPKISREIIHMMLLFIAGSAFVHGVMGVEMSEEEVECVAEELAKVGGVAWYPGREPNAILRVVSDRYRDRARVAIAALERLRASREQQGAVELAAGEDPEIAHRARAGIAEDIEVGSVVIYRAPGDLGRSHAE